MLEWARANDAILLTDDLDFGELVFRQRRAASGVLLLRMAGLSLARKRAIVLDALNEHGQDLYGRFAVLDLRQLRIRPLQV
ncbi:MAG TPA: hypothetical protein DCM87_08920 [Planctomycetes bacterium]|nr:hypothetical protein [Planctomycetota bacterium]